VTHTGSADPSSEAHVHADELGHTFSDDMVERIDAKLGHPERCPHGWPVDPDVEQAENRELEPLSALEPGTRATVVRLAEHDGDLLHWFYDQGLAPGQEIEVREAEDGDRVLATLDGREELRYLHRRANLEDVFLKLTGRDLRD
jgi:Mn-dependent DtxR family transcriptional regulator